MMPDRAVNLNMLYEKVGEVGAIAREAKHAANGASTKIDALAIVVAAQGETRAHVERLEKEVEHQAGKLEVLEADKLRRDGAIGLIEWLCKHWPFTVIIAALGALVMWANGRLG